MKRITGADLRDHIAAQVDAEQIAGMDAALVAAGLSWEEIAFKSRGIVRTLDGIDVPDDARIMLFAGYAHGFLRGLGHGMGLGDDEPSS